MAEKKGGGYGEGEEAEVVEGRVPIRQGLGWWTTADMGNGGWPKVETEREREGPDPVTWLTGQ